MTPGDPPAPQFALKIGKGEKYSKMVRNEHETLQKLAGLPQVCGVHGSGWHSATAFYMALDLLGQNLVEMRRGAYGGRMDLATAKVRAGAGAGAGRAGGWGSLPGNAAPCFLPPEWIRMDSKCRQGWPWRKRR